MQLPPTIAILGYKDSGKTMVATHIIAHLTSKGRQVLACKRVGEPSFTLDRPGTDSHRLAESGASAVILHSEASTTLLSRPVESLNQLIRMGLAASDADVVVMEGFTSWTRGNPEIAKVFCVRREEEIDELSQGLAGPLLATCTLKPSIPGTLRLPDQLGEILERVDGWLAASSKQEGV